MTAPVAALLQLLPQPQRPQRPRHPPSRQRLPLRPRLSLRLLLPSRWSPRRSETFRLTSCRSSTATQFNQFLSPCKCSRARHSQRPSRREFSRGLSLRSLRPRHRLPLHRKPECPMRSRRLSKPCPKLSPDRRPKVNHSPRDSLKLTRWSCLSMAISSPFRKDFRRP